MSKIINWSAIDIRSKELCLDLKHDLQLVWLQELYPSKMARIQAHITAIDARQMLGTEEDKFSLQNKIVRLNNKYKALLDEIAGRKDNKFLRKPIGTLYYIDLDNGDDENDGLSKEEPWLTLQKYTTVTVRSPGDIAYVRAGTTQVKSDAHLEFDESGDKDIRIAIIGCDSVVNDPWGDGSDVKPTLDFDGSNKYLYLYEDYFWEFQRFVTQNNFIYSGLFRGEVTSGCYLLDLEIKLNSYSSGKGLYFTYSRDLLIDGLKVEDCNGDDMCFSYGTRAFLRNCVSNGGSTYTSRIGLGAEYGSIVDCVDCEFGQIIPHFDYDVRTFFRSVVNLRNCKMAIDKARVQVGGVIHVEDNNGVAGTNETISCEGKVTKDTGVTRDGGADSSAKMEPTSECGKFAALTLGRKSIVDKLFKLWMGVEARTITIYIRSLGAWSIYPTNEELYVEASYLDHATNRTRAIVKSTQILSDESTWTAFTVDVNPQQEGFVYLDVYLHKYEENKGCYVDIKPIMS